MTRRGAAFLAGAMVAALVHCAHATRFHDINDTVDANAVVFEETWDITIQSTPTRLQFLVPRVEDLPDDGEIAVFNQAVTVTYDCDPPCDFEDRSEWYTRIEWTGLQGAARVTVRATNTISCAARIQGSSMDLTRHPGAFYTDYTPTIQYVAGIDEAIHHLEETMDDVPGYPGGDSGLAQRWAVFLRGTLSPGPCPGGSDAATVWAGGVADCDGYANVFASGLRSLAIPACVVVGYDLPGGLILGGVSYGDPGHGYHAWAGAWSEGLQAFLPLDITGHEFGLVDAQRVHLAYHDDVTNHIAIVAADDGSASLSTWPSPSFRQSNSGTPYTESRTRFVDDGFSFPFFTNEVTGLHAPGGVTGVPDPDSTRTQTMKLLVSSPFRAALTVSLLTDEPVSVTVEIFDALGRRVAAPAIARTIGPGESFFRWIPDRAPSGVYFIRAVTGGGVTRVGRAVLLR